MGQNYFNAIPWRVARQELGHCRQMSRDEFKDGTKALYDELFATLSDIDDKFSTQKPYSELVALHDSAGIHPRTVSNDVFFVVQQACHFSALTDGAFDITIGPLVSLWGINTDHARIPTVQEIARALPLINWHHIMLDEKNTQIYLQQPEMSLDAGAIAKGYAADALVQILHAKNVRQALIDLGGNIYVFGKKSDGSPWRVGIKNPEHPYGTPLLVLTTEETSVVTSGVYERFLEQDGVHYHHILDKQTGYPVDNNLLSVTVVAPSSLTADALSTGLFVLGKEKGLEHAEKIGVEAIFIDDSRTIWTTPRIRNSLELLQEGYTFEK